MIIDNLNKDYIYFDEIILLLFLPAIDTSRITIERIIRESFPSDKLYFHHLLNKLMDKRFIFMAYLFSTNTYQFNVLVHYLTFSFNLFLCIY